MYDIALTEPLRKVNDVADTIEFPSETEGKALVTRPLKSVDMSSISWSMGSSSKSSSDGFYGIYGVITDGVKISSGDNSTIQNILSPIYEANSFNNTWTVNEDNDKTFGYGLYYGENYRIRVQDSDYSKQDSLNAFIEHVRGAKLIYELETPTTEFVDVSQFPVSSTDTYTSANVVPFSAFEHTENKEIWSCGEYNATDGKYHIVVQPQGGSIADIALTEPLRKVNDVADTIEFPSNTEGKALVTRSIQSKKWNTLTIAYQTFNNYDRLYTNVLSGILLPTSMDDRTKICLSADFVQNTAPTQANVQANPTDKCMCVFSNGQIYIRDTSVSNASDFVTKYGEKEFLYILATPSTELVDAPQIEEADSYSMVISQGAKAVEWSRFETE